MGEVRKEDVYDYVRDNRPPAASRSHDRMAVNWARMIVDFVEMHGAASVRAAFARLEETIEDPEAEYDDELEPHDEEDATA